MEQTRFVRFDESGPSVPVEAFLPHVVHETFPQQVSLMSCAVFHRLHYSAHPLLGRRENRKAYVVRTRDMTPQVYFTHTCGSPNRGDFYWGLMTGKIIPQGWYAGGGVHRHPRCACTALPVLVQKPIAKVAQEKSLP